MYRKSEKTDILKKEADIKGLVLYLKDSDDSEFSQIIKIKVYAYNNIIDSCEDEKQKLRLKKEKIDFYQIIEDIFIQKMKDNIDKIEKDDQIKMKKDDYNCFAYKDLIMLEFNKIIEIYNNIIDSCKNKEQGLDLNNKRMDFCEKVINILKYRTKKDCSNKISIKSYNYVYKINYINIIIEIYNNIIDSCEDEEQKLRLKKEKIDFYQIIEDIFIQKMKDNIDKIEKDDQIKMKKDDYNCFAYKDLIMLEFNKIIEIYNNIIDSCKNKEQGLDLNNKRMDFCEKVINILKYRTKKDCSNKISIKSYNYVYKINYNNIIIEIYNNMINNYCENGAQQLDLYNKQMVFVHIVENIFIVFYPIIEDMFIKKMKDNIDKIEKDDQIKMKKDDYNCLADNNLIIIIINIYDTMIDRCENKEPGLDLNNKKMDFCKKVINILKKRVERDYSNKISMKPYNYVYKINYINIIIKIYNNMIDSCENKVEKLRLEKEKINFYQIIEDIFIQKIEDIFIQNMKDNINKITEDDFNYYFVNRNLIMLEFNKIIEIYNNIIDSCKNDEQVLELDNKKMNFCEKVINIVKNKSVETKDSIYCYNQVLWSSSLDFTYYYSNLEIDIYDKTIDSCENEELKLELNIKKTNSYEEITNYYMKEINLIDSDITTTNNKILNNELKIEMSHFKDKENSLLIKLRKTCIDKKNSFYIKLKKTCMSAIYHCVELDKKLNNKIEKINSHLKESNDQFENITKKLLSPDEILLDSQKLKKFKESKKSSLDRLKILHCELRKKYILFKLRYADCGLKNHTFYKNPLDVCGGILENHYNQQNYDFNKAKNIKVSRTSNNQKKIYQYYYFDEVKNIAASKTFNNKEEKYRYKLISVFEKVEECYKIKKDIYEKLIKSEQEKFLQKEELIKLGQEKLIKLEEEELIKLEKEKLTELKNEKSIIYVCIENYKENYKNHNDELLFYYKETLNLYEEMFKKYNDKEKYYFKEAEKIQALGKSEKEIINKKILTYRKEIDKSQEMFQNYSQKQQNYFDKAKSIEALNISNNKEEIYQYKLADYFQEAKKFHEIKKDVYEKLIKLQEKKLINVSVKNVDYEDILNTYQNILQEKKLTSISKNLTSLIDYQEMFQNYSQKQQNYYNKGKKIQEFKNVKEDMMTDEEKIYKYEKICKYKLAGWQYILSADCFEKANQYAEMKKNIYEKLIKLEKENLIDKSVDYKEAYNNHNYQRSNASSNPLIKLAQMFKKIKNM